MPNPLQFDPQIKIGFPGCPYHLRGVLLRLFPAEEESEYPNI
jgi:hypothetical protein